MKIRVQKKFFRARIFFTIRLFYMNNEYNARDDFFIFSPLLP